MSRAHPKHARGPRRRSLTWFLVLSLGGLALSLVLARIHRQALLGGAPSFCSLGEAVDCDRVALSPYASFLGVPVAIWGAFGYASMLLLAATGLRDGRDASSWPTGMLLVFSGAAAAVSLPLAFTSAFALRTLCLLCAATWVIDWALFAVALRQSRDAGGPARVIGVDVHAVASHPGRAFAGAAVGSALLAVALLAYRAPPRPNQAATTATAPRTPEPTRVAAPPAGQDLTIVEFSDYECPHCARAHQELRAALANRPGVRLEHRNFPLDQDCNPIVPRPFHRHACALARAAICAGDQGRFWEMNDALFANQAAGRPIEDLAASVGLDLEPFRRCLQARETADRLAEDIAAGIRASVSATPSYAVGGRLYPGRVPDAVLPPVQ